MTCGLCKDCKWFRRKQKENWSPELDVDVSLYGKCRNGSFVYTGGRDPRYPDVDGLGYWDAESYAAGFEVGENFGCVHFESVGKGENS